jgi:hypothetical protein
MSRRVKGVSPTLRRFFQNREGVSEIVGGVMLIIILMFFFTNVYLWHDQATRQMNDALSTKMNSPVSIAIAPSGNLVVTNNGGVDVALSRLWIINGSLHLFADFESLADYQPWVGAGNSTELDFNASAPVTNVSPIAVTWNGEYAVVQYSVSGNVSFKIITANGNSASCSITQSNNGTANANVTIAPVVADFQNFTYYNVTGGSNSFTVDLTSGGGNFVNSNNGSIAFRVVLTNIASQKQSIYLNATSQLFFVYARANSTVGNAVFYVVNVSESGNLGILGTTYTPMELPYNVPTPVYFAAQGPIIGSTSFQPANRQSAVGVCVLNIALLGTIGSNPFGQNISYISVYINN